jgi:hypothetical protein
MPRYEQKPSLRFDITRSKTTTGKSGPISRDHHRIDPLVPQSRSAGRCAKVSNWVFHSHVALPRTGSGIAVIVIERVGKCSARLVGEKRPIWQSDSSRDSRRPVHLSDTATIRGRELRLHRTGGGVLFEART